MDPVQFLKCILLFSLDRIMIYWNKLYDLRNLVGLPVWFVGPYKALLIKRKQWLAPLLATLETDGAPKYYKLSRVQNQKVLIIW